MRAFDLTSTVKKKTVLAASTGGHLSQLLRLSEEFEFIDDPLWITFENHQSRSMLKGRRTVFVPYIPPRGFSEAMNAVPIVRAALKEERHDVAISTGAALAAVVLPQSAAMGRSSVYIESISRFLGPSLTGRMMRFTPGVQTYTQHESWASGRWQLGPSVLKTFKTVPSEAQLGRPLRIFVTLGTIKPYKFLSLITNVQRIVPSDCEIFWQLGESIDAPVNIGEKVDSISSDAFDSKVNWSDIVISHSGVGSALRVMELGKMPILVPRRSRRGEHVDDHQSQVADVLSAEGLAIRAEVDELNLELLKMAMDRKVIGGGMTDAGNNGVGRS